VPPAAHGQRKTIRSSGTHRLLHISRALTEGKQRWPAINCAVENLPRPLVGSLTRDCDLALHYGAQVFCVIPNSFLVSVRVIFASPLSVFGVRRITDLDVGGEILSEALSTLAAGGRLRS
jgi:hypothetical protein